MIASLKAKAITGGVTALLLVSAYGYWQYITGERDAYQAEAQRQQARADVLQEHQQWQRQQIQVLNDALAERDQALAVIADDISASKAALQQLGETDGEARDWLDRDVPTGIDDWLRQLQQPSPGDGVRLPDDTGTPDG
ncbi:hypothetical protein [Halomonas halocynthiae]|uniref:hypothetical protein n=1 Tax=Halomonas halocynthiae TaxID=176290 RepID=UPI0003F9D8C3|nr:hypothetical protein [Halomonas halocynthiae]